MTIQNTPTTVHKMSQLDSIIKFFSILYDKIPIDDLILLCRLRGEDEILKTRSSQRIDVKSFKKAKSDDVARYVLAESIQKNLPNWFVQVCTTDLKRLRNNTRSKETEITTVTSFYVDIDYADVIAHKKNNLPPDKISVLNMLDEVFIKPTMIIHSGNGVHAYWVLEEPISTNNIPISDLKEINYRIHSLFKIKSDSLGYKIDSIFDMARILRIPGTSNVKTDKKTGKTTVKNCEFEECYGVKYTLDDIKKELDSREAIIMPSKNIASNMLTPSVISDKKRALLPYNQLSQDTNINQTQKTNSPIIKKELAQGDKSFDFDGETIILSPKAVLSVDDYESLTCISPNIVQILSGKYDTAKYPSTSECDFELAKVAVECMFTTQQIANLLIHFRVTNQLSIEKCMRPSYVATTIKNARISVSRREIARKAEDVHIYMNTEMGDKTTLGNDEESVKQKEEFKKDISEILGINILKVIKHNGDDPSYTIKTSAGDIFFQKIDDLTSKTRFKNKIAATINRIPLLPKDFSSLANLLLTIVENDVDDGSLKRAEIIKSFIHEYYNEYLAKNKRYLENTDSDSEKENEIIKSIIGDTSDRAPFFENKKYGNMFFFFDHFVSWAKEFRKNEISQSDIRIILKSIPGCKETTKYHGGFLKKIWIYKNNEYDSE